MHYSLSDFIVDIVENAVEADAALIDLRLDQDENRFSVRIDDNGRGMAPGELERALDPFYTDGKKHRNRKVGLGLPFLKQATELAGGEFDIRSVKNSGTSVSWSFPLDHIDTPPLGELPMALFQVLLFEGDYELVVRRSRGDAGAGGSYTVRRSELREALGDLSESGSLVLLRAFLESQENEAGSRS